MTKVHFNKPICIGIDGPPKPERPAGSQITYHDIRKLVEQYQARGWDDRSIVVRADCHKYGKTQPANWGVVVDLSRQVPMLGQAYIPFTVKWCQDGKLTKHWPEDLLLIHESLSIWDIECRIKEQEGPPC